jgi:hypothetical protein
VSEYRKALQNAFVDDLISGFKNATYNSTLHAARLSALQQLQRQLNGAGGNADSKAHFGALKHSIDKALAIK